MIDIDKLIEYRKILVARIESSWAKLDSKLTYTQFKELELLRDQYFESIEDKADQEVIEKLDKVFRDRLIYYNATYEDFSKCYNLLWQLQGN